MESLLVAILISIFDIKSFECGLPLPTSTTDPAMMKHLEKMWHGYNKAENTFAFFNTVMQQCTKIQPDITYLITFS